MRYSVITEKNSSLRLKVAVFKPATLVIHGNRNDWKELVKVKRTYNFVITKGYDGYYVATVPELPGVITQAKKVEEIFSRVREAIEVYLETMDEGSIEDSHRFVGVNQIEVEVS